jgi:voltage-gated sodium channel
MANGATTSAGAPAQQAGAARGGIALFRTLTQNAFWEIFILGCIITNAAILGYDAHFGDTNPHHALIERWNLYFLLIFTAELFLEFLAQGPKRYFRYGWNNFDVAVVALSYIAVNPAIAALRTLRVVRVFRLISAVPQMRRVVEALFSAMPGILATMAILAVVFYIGAVMGTTLFHNEEGFRNLGESALTLFALSQFDGWGEIVTALQVNYPYAWVFVMAFTVVAAFAVLNLFIGVIVEAVQSAPQLAMKDEIDDLEDDVEDIAEAQEDAAIVQQRILDEIRALREEVAALRSSGGPPPAG